LSLLDRPPKDRDLGHDVYMMKRVVWSLAMAVIGGMIGNLLAGTLGFVIGFFVAGIGLFFVTGHLVGGGVHLAQQIHMPSDGVTPPKREYSQAESLVARGRYEEAAIAYEIHCAEYHEDPDPYFRLARLFASPHMERYEDAVVWYRRARSTAKLSPGEDLVACQSIIELYLHKIRDPRKAIPEMARLAQVHAETAAGQAAGQELAIMRELMAKEHEGLVKFTEEFLARLPHSSGDPPPSA
jgi:hypothetical protein